MDGELGVGGVAAHSAIGHGGWDGMVMGLGMAG